MRAVHKSKRVTWASDVNLCQVRLFLSEESPSQVGVGGQDHLQAKTSLVSHINGATGDDFLPPGFEGAHSTSHLQINLLEIATIKWRCPLRFILDLNWQVVAGEESEEVEIQNQREVRVLEAVYPRPSAIPTNSSVSADVENCDYDDQQTPQIPITPIEDEDAATETPISSQPQWLAPGILPPLRGSMPSVSSGSADEKPASGMILNVEPGVAAAAFAAVNQNNEPGNMIDPETENGTASLSATSSGTFYAQPNGVGVGPSNKQGLAPNPHPISVSAAVGLPQKKDVNYYKNLIQQHGGERQEPAQKFNSRYNQHLRPNQELINNTKSRDSRPKIMKPCMYFNSSRGCRNGANCAYQHDTSSHQNSGNNVAEVPNTKRMKMDREISG
ncbi:hypothetical protein CXB51_005510 [Gossypium anomalum]|uniref:C3H1-type domain-containing protein n=1 Tax=Gossypium anomalum TaxID=47600 RepID=A0A8J5YYL5_9ROSI|nr:hypothetical protein CXB51_005510 [Gossypium anomalum]